MENQYYPFVNQPLPYAYDALEPFIDEKTMRLHHDKHLQTYIQNLNAALKNYPQLQRLSLEQLIRTSARPSCELQRTIHNNAGGVYNHRFFFAGLKNPGKWDSSQPSMPVGELGNAVRMQYGSYEAFREAFSKAALSVFGSGYAWLVLDGGRLRIITTANQDSPVGENLCPVLGIDVWEHAYYLKHYNVRADYIEDWWHVVNWEKAEENYRECHKIWKRMRNI
ncbi:MAG: superoxide dismutase [Lachnospiraceae bacterium]|nr:superoxide dismutase [Lachnospiraceae bacterium]